MSDTIIVMQKSDAINIVKGWNYVEISRDDPDAYECVAIKDIHFFIKWFRLSQDYEDKPISVYADGKWEQTFTHEFPAVVYYFRDARDAVEFKLRFG